jgi:hypothetical protein
MLSHQFIFEYKQDITIKQYGKGIINRLTTGPDKNEVSDINDTNQLLSLAFGTFEKGDPTYNQETKQGGIYIQWIAREYSVGNIERLEDIPTRVRNALTLYNQVKKKGDFPVDYRDIMRINWGKLQDVLEKYKPKQQEVNRGKYKDIYDDNDVRVIHPLDIISACYYGQGTRWCTAARKDNYFDRYNSKGALYIIIPKKPRYNGEKYQFHFEDNEFKDPVNDDIDPANMRQLFIRYPILEQLFVNMFIKTGNLKYVPEKLKTPDICLAAVRKNGKTLRYVPEKLKTPYICLEAVEQNSYALRYIPDNLKESQFYIRAVKQDGNALKYVPEEFKTPEICLAAVKQKGYSIIYVPNNIKTDDICLAAVKEDASALFHVPEKLKTPELYVEAIGQNVNALKYVPGNLKTTEFYLKAIKKNSNVVKYVPEKLKTREFYLEAIVRNGRALQYVPEELKTPRLCTLALVRNVRALQFVPEELKTPERCLAAVRTDGNTLQYVPEPLKTPELCLAAVKKSPRALEYVPDRLKDTIRNQLKGNNDVNESLSRIKELIGYKL